MPGAVRRPRWVTNVAAAAQRRLRKRPSRAAGVEDKPHSIPPANPMETPMPCADVQLSPNCEFEDSDEEENEHDVCQPRPEQDLAIRNMEPDRDSNLSRDFTTKYQPPPIDEYAFEGTPPPRYRLTRKQMYARLREAAKKHATKFSKIPKIPKAPKIHIPKRIHEEDAEEDEYERDPETEYNLRDTRWDVLRRGISKRWSKVSEPDPYPQSEYSMINDSHIYVPHTMPHTQNDTVVAHNLAQAIQASGLPPPTFDSASSAAAGVATATTATTITTTTTTTRTTTTTTAAAAAAAAIAMNPGFMSINAPPTMRPTGRFQESFHLPGIVSAGKPVTSKKGAAKSMSTAMGSAGQGLMGLTTWAAW